MLFPDFGGVKVKISSKMMRLKFNGCDPDYIKTTCHGACCRSPSSPTGVMVTIHPSEISKIAAYGVKVVDQFVQPNQGEHRCPFQHNESHLCNLHTTQDKPFGCIASPFTLNKNGTLIVRHRYISLKCYNDGKKIPAYKAFKASLDLIFGQKEATRIVAELDAGSGDFTAEMTLESYAKLISNDIAKKRLLKKQ